MKKRYLRKQKLMGLGLLLVAALTVVLLNGDFTAALFLTPLAALLIFEKRVVLSGYYEERSRRAK